MPDGHHMVLRSTYVGSVSRGRARRGRAEVSVGPPGSVGGAELWRWGRACRQESGQVAVARTCRRSSRVVASIVRSQHVLDGAHLPFLTAFLGPLRSLSWISSWA